MAEQLSSTRPSEFESIADSPSGGQGRPHWLAFGQCFRENLVVLPHGPGAGLFVSKPATSPPGSASNGDSTDRRMNPAQQKPAQHSLHEDDSHLGGTPHESMAPLQHQQHAPNNTNGPASPATGQLPSTDLVTTVQQVQLINPMQLRRHVCYLIHPAHKPSWHSRASALC